MIQSKELIERLDAIDKGYAQRMLKGQRGVRIQVDPELYKREVQVAKANG